MEGRGEKEDRCRFLRKRPRPEGGHPGIYLTSRICPDDSVFFFKLPLNSDLANLFVMNRGNSLTPRDKRTILAMFSKFSIIAYFIITRRFLFFTALKFLIRCINKLSYGVCDTKGKK